VRPRRSDALAVTWLDVGEELQIQAGHGGGPWELGRNPEDVDFLEDVARSVIAGRVVEVFGPNRSRVEVTLADGTQAVETGYNGLRACLPKPG
jgi:hypothetical protein